MTFDKEYTINELMNTSLVELREYLDKVNMMYFDLDDMESEIAKKYVSLIELPPYSFARNPASFDHTRSVEAKERSMEIEKIGTDYMKMRAKRLASVPVAVINTLNNYYRSRRMHNGNY